MTGATATANVENATLAKPAAVAQAHSTPLSERIWKYAFFCISLVFAVLIDRTYKYRQTTPPEQLRGNPYYLLLCLPIFVFFHYTKILVDRMLAKEIADRLCEKRFLTAEKKEERSHLLTKWVFDIIYYVSTTVVGVWIMHDHESFPDFMNGDLRCKNVLNKDIPDTHALAIEMFYIVQLSHHLYALISHWFTSNVYGSTKFYEFCLHHGMAVFLIFYSYMLNFWLIGVMVLIYHDVSDAFLILGRFYLDMKFKKMALIYVIYVVMLTVWVVSRLVLFPTCCILPALDKASCPEENFLLGMQVGLLIMHIYWTYWIAASAAFSRRKNNY